MSAAQDGLGTRAALADTPFTRNERDQFAEALSLRSDCWKDMQEIMRINNALLARVETLRKALTEISSFQGVDNALDITASEMRATARAALAATEPASPAVKTEEAP